MDYEWSAFDEVESAFNEAASNVKASEARLLKIKERMDEILSMKNKNIIDANPPSIDISSSSTMMAPKRSPSNDDVEYMALGRALAKSLGKTAVGGSKAALFGLKTFLDSVTEGKDQTDESERNKGI